jgi:hypothetical protein
MFQWGPDSELNEVESIEDRYAELGPAVLQPEIFRATTAKEAYREYVARLVAGYPGDALQDWLRGEAAAAQLVSPADVVSYRVTRGDPQFILNQMRVLFRLSTNVQTIYFSCHGTLNELSFNSELSSTIAFADFGGALGELRQDFVTLVLGCCYGLNEHSALLGHIPSKIYEIFAFTGKPRAPDVASLMLGVLMNESSLYAQVSSANRLCFGAGVPLDETDVAIARLGECIDVFLDAFAGDPTAYVRGAADGVSVRWLRRVEYDGRLVWQGKTIPLRNR